MKLLCSPFKIFLLTSGFVQVFGTAYDYDLSSSLWRCAPSWTYMNRELTTFDLIRVHANGKIGTTDCSLYWVAKDPPYKLSYEWDKLWNSSAINITLTLSTRYSVFSSWNEVWKITGSESHVPLRGDLSAYVRLEIINPENEQAFFQFTIKPPNGAPIDIPPWALSLICIGVALVLAAAAFTFYFCRGRQRNNSNSVAAEEAQRLN